MKRIAVAMFVSLLLLAGCGSGRSKSNGVAAKTADQIVADAQTAAAGATSVHVAGAQGSARVIILSLVAGKGGKGRITANGLTFDMVRIGPTAYFKGDSAFWRQFGGQAMAQLMGDRWLKAPATSGQLSSFAPLTDITKLFNSILSSHGTLKKGVESTRNGVKVIAVDDTTQGGTLYVATTGGAYPIAIEQAGKGTISFDRWNETVELEAPTHSVDISKLKG
jgi:hypothetical protein